MTTTPDETTPPAGQDPPRPGTPASAPPTGPRRGRSWVRGVVVVLGLLVGIPAGLLLRPDRTEIRVTRTSSTETQPVEITAPSCLTALEIQGRIIRLLAEINLKFDRAGRAEDSVARLREIQGEIAEIRQQIGELSGAAQTSRQECESATPPSPTPAPGPSPGAGPSPTPST